jgi:hypothetical protein
MSEHNDEGGDVVQQQENPMEDASRQSIELISISSVEQGLGSAEFDIDKERFNLAKYILIHLFWLLVVMVAIRLLPDNLLNAEFKDIFNTIFQSIVPIASLIIGYYFGSKGSKE